MSTTCYSTIVGFSKQPCNCITGGETSLSGLYLDDISAGVIPLNQAVYECNEDSIGTVLSGLIESAVYEAIRLTKQATLNTLRKRYLDLNSTIGKKDSYTAAIGSVTTDWYYLAIKPINIRGSYFKLNRIKVYPFTGGAFTGTVKVIDDEGTELFSGAIGTFTGLNLKLDKTYFVAYQHTQPPKNFKHTACCGYTPTYKQYAYIGSGTVSDLDDLEFAENEYCQGIELEGHFYCDGFDFICDLDFKNNDFGSTFAEVVLQVARKNLGYWMLTNDKITPYTSLQREQLAETVRFLEEDINERVNYLPHIYNHSDCYSCGVIAKGQILI